jgi:hypothetical protein
MQLTVTMQLNVGLNEAGDWANRSAGCAAKSTGRRSGSQAARRNDEAMIRLFDLRGAIEAMRQAPCGTSLADTRTSRSNVAWGDPVHYRGMSFVLRAD